MSHYRKIALAVFAALTLTPACALLKKPTPLTQLQVSLNAAELQWPEQLELGGVKARGMLQSDRMIVTNGALVMQHAGLRWIAAPATQLTEQLAMASVSTSIPAAQKRSGKKAVIDVWLSDFNISVGANGDTSVAVSASATVRCAPAKKVSQLTPAALVLPLNSTDPQRIAQTFNDAANKVLASLLMQGAETSSKC